MTFWIFMFIWVIEMNGTYVLWRLGYIRRMQMHLFDGFIELIFGLFILLYLDQLDGTGALLLVMAAYDFYQAWKHRNDNDDDDKGKRLWSKLKSKIPKPTIAVIRPIQQGA